MCAVVQYAAIINWCFYRASVYKYISPKAAHGSPGDNFLSQQTNLENVCLTTAKNLGNLHLHTVVQKVTRDCTSAVRLC